MTAVFIFSGLIDFIIMGYTFYFLTKVRFYPCIKQKMDEDIHFWSWLVAICGMVAGFMPYYSFRAIFRGIDNITLIAAIFQILVYLYAIVLYNFHIKTTKNEKRIF